jgi:hypothetical protein
MCLNLICECYILGLAAKPFRFGNAISVLWGYFFVSLKQHNLIYRQDSGPFRPKKIAASELGQESFI